jgi:hypothetical protein
MLLLPALFTEVLIAFEKERELATAWLISLLSFGVLTVSGNVITITATAILLYIFISTIVLAFLIVRAGVKIWKLDLSQILWEKLR